MILDEGLELLRLAGVGTAGLSSDVVDFSRLARDVGPGEPVYLVASLVTINGANGATVTLRSSDTYGVLGANDDVVTLEVPVGSGWGPQSASIALPANLKRYLGVHVKTGSGTAQMNVFLTTNPSAPLRGWR